MSAWVWSLSKRALGMAAVAAFALAACTGVGEPPPPPTPAVTPSPAPPPLPVPDTRPEPSAPGETCQGPEILAQFNQLMSLSADDQRREYQSAQQAFQIEATDANRLRLMLTFALPRPPAREDPRVLRLLESAEPPVREPGCAAPLVSTLMKLGAERWRLLREEQRRHEAQLKDEQRGHEMNLREEIRRYDGMLREERQRNAELKQKLDALIDIDRRLRRESHGPRK